MKIIFNKYIANIAILLILAVNNIFADSIEIIGQSNSITECMGNDVIFSVDAQSGENLKLNYQWYKDNQIILGETNSVLRIDTINYKNSGTYFCRIKEDNSDEFIDSKPASLYVLVQTSITQEPVDIKLGENFDKDYITISFLAHINGYSDNGVVFPNEDVKINWYLVEDNKNFLLNDDENFFGTKSNKLSIKLLNLKDTSYFFSIVTGKCGRDTTRVSRVIKNSKDLILNININDLNACDGNIYSIKAEIQSTVKDSDIDYRWYKDGKPLYNKANLKGIFSDELIFNPIFKEDAGKYRLEGRVGDSNLVSFSNIIDVKVNQKPEIVCIRIDTMDNIIQSIYGGLYIFYNANSDSNYIDIYKDGELFATYPPAMSSWYFYNFNNINCCLITGALKSDKESKYWAVIRNECGEAYSDTVSIINDLNDFSKCDPWNQYHVLCEGDSVVFETNFKKNYGSFSKRYSWHSNVNNEYMYNDDVIRENSKLTINNIKREHSGRYRLTVSYLDTFHISHCYIIDVKGNPKIVSEPKNKSIIAGSTETIFDVGIKNYFGDTTNIKLYKIPFNWLEPILIEESLVSVTGDYLYRKRVNKEDEGNYYAVLTNGYCGYTITDTVSVIVTSSGQVSDICKMKEIENEIRISPNPATDFITINPGNKGLKPFAETDEQVEIYNSYGDLVFKEVPHLQDVAHLNSIDVSHLPVGLYFVKIGDRIEKFVKM